MLDLGPVEKNIAMQAMRSGEPMPERIANAPQLINGLELYLNAFFDLDSDRNIGMDVGRIPWSVIDRYASAYAFDIDQYESLHFFLGQMDTAHLKKIKQKIGK